MEALGSLNILLAAAITTAPSAEDSTDDDEEQEPKEEMSVTEALELWTKYKAKQGEIDFALLLFILPFPSFCAPSNCTFKSRLYPFSLSLAGCLVFHLYQSVYLFICLFVFASQVNILQSMCQKTRVTQMSAMTGWRKSCSRTYESVMYLPGMSNPFSNFSRRSITLTWKTMTSLTF